MSDLNDKKKNESDALALNEADLRILRAVRDVAYGSVEITIHNRRVVQVERREKIRLPHDSEGHPHAR
jgi:hypothetical protein